MAPGSSLPDIPIGREIPRDVWLLFAYYQLVPNLAVEVAFNDKNMSERKCCLQLGSTKKKASGRSFLNHIYPGP